MSKRKNRIPKGFKAFHVPHDHPNYCGGTALVHTRTQHGTYCTLLRSGHPDLCAGTHPNELPNAGFRARPDFYANCTQIVE